MSEFFCEFVFKILTMFVFAPTLRKLCAKWTHITKIVQNAFQNHSNGSTLHFFMYTHYKNRSSVYFLAGKETEHKNKTETQK